MGGDTTWTEADGELLASGLASAIESLLDGIALAEARLQGRASDDVAAFERGVATMTVLRPLAGKAKRAVITSETES